MLLPLFRMFVKFSFEWRMAQSWFLYSLPRATHALMHSRTLALTLGSSLRFIVFIKPLSFSTFCSHFTSRFFKVAVFSAVLDYRYRKALLMKAKRLIQGLTLAPDQSQLCIPDFVNRFSG